MAGRTDDRSLKSVLGHPTRKTIVGLLWHLGEPATVPELRGSLPKEPTPANVAYHCRVLERADVIQVVGDPFQPAYVVGGDNAAEAVRELGL